MALKPSVYVHPNALVETESIGERTRVWAFAHVMKNVTIGEDCNVGDHSFIEAGVTVGDRVTIKNGVSIWSGVDVADDVFIGPNAAFTNDLFPRSKVYLEKDIHTTLERGASIGANATVIAGVHVGAYALIGAGSVVSKDVKDFELVYGNPAQHGGWISKKGSKLIFDTPEIQMDGEIYVLEGGKVSNKSDR
jgi:acetyltransferase-like isoleucine patch superfamily enzyme